MPSRKRSARPLSNLTPAEQRPDKYNKCPKCGGAKSKTAKACFECKRVRDLSTGYWVKRDWYDYCPICGTGKKFESRFCKGCSCANRRTKVSDQVFFIKGKPCRWIGLTRGQATAVSAGRYAKLSQWNWQATWAPTARRFYVYRAGGISMHRQIMRFPKGMQVDHKDKNPLNNTDGNLRVGTCSQNRANSKTQEGSRSGYKGVSWDKKSGKWRIRIMIRGTSISLGYDTNPIHGAKVYDEAAIRYFGDFAQLNFPQ